MNFPRFRSLFTLEQFNALEPRFKIPLIGLALVSVIGGLSALNPSEPSSSIVRIGSEDSPAMAQRVYQSGYDLGPNYGNMLNQTLNDSNNLTRQMDQTMTGITSNVMQKPDFQQKFWQYRQNGGTKSPRDYAADYGATRGFTQAPPAINRSGEQRAWWDLQDAERSREDAQVDYMGGGQRINRDVGNYILDNRCRYPSAGDPNCYPSR